MMDSQNPGAFLEITSCSCPVEVEAFMGQPSQLRLSSKGNQSLLQRKKLALICSVKCPGKLILDTYDLMRKIREIRATVVSGFHSPMEQECLSLLLRGDSSVIVCPARSLVNARFPSEYQKPLLDGKMLLMSAFDEKCRRTTSQTSEMRNRLVAAVADVVLIPYASFGGKTEQLCREIISWGKPVHTLESEHNSSLISAGAVTVAKQDFDHLLRRLM